MITEAQRKAQKRYDRKTKQFVFRVNPDTEQDVYRRLMSVSNRAGYLKDLVRRDIDSA